QQDKGIADVWDAKNGVHLGRFVDPPPENPALAPNYAGNAAFSPDGRYVLMAELIPHVVNNLGLNAVDVELWDLTTGKIYKQYTYDVGTDKFKFDFAVPRTTMFSPDGKQILLVDESTNSILINIASGTAREISFWNQFTAGYLAFA